MDNYTNSATYSASLYLENDQRAEIRFRQLWIEGNLNGKAVEAAFRHFNMEIDSWGEGKVNWEEIAADFTERFVEGAAYEPPASNTVLTIISSAVIENKTVKLTSGQLERSVYEKVAKILTTLGGKWNKKAGGFVFPTDPSEQIEDVLLTGKVKKPEKYGFFPTPPELAKKVIELANLEPGQLLLEPEAGSGNLADLAAELVGKDHVTCCELQAMNVQLLTEKGYQVSQDDFLNVTPAPIFDRVVMNPPFEKQQDISHVLHAWKFLKPGGRLTSIMSTGMTFRSDKKSTDFRAFVDSHGYFIVNPEGSFKPSGTNVATITVVLDKPMDDTVPATQVSVADLFKEPVLPTADFVVPPPVMTTQFEQFSLF